MRKYPCFHKHFRFNRNRNVLNSNHKGFQSLVPLSDIHSRWNRFFHFEPVPHTLVPCLKIGGSVSKAVGAWFLQMDFLRSFVNFFLQFFHVAKSMKHWLGKSILIHWQVNVRLTFSKPYAFVSSNAFFNNKASLGILTFGGIIFSIK